MKKNNPTSQIGELLNKTTFGEMIKENKVGQIMKHSTIFSFWNNVVGAKFSKFTKPYAIKFNKLYEIQGACNDKKEYRTINFRKI